MVPSSREPRGCAGRSGRSDKSRRNHPRSCQTARSSRLEVRPAAYRPSSTARSLTMTITTTHTPADELSHILLDADVSSSLWAAVKTGRVEELVPELLAMQMEQDPIHTHKDVLTHTIAVVAKTPPDLLVRLGALFHDVGKPRTRSYEHGGVTFRHHEAVGARMTRKRLAAMGYPADVVDDVTELVRLSGRFKGYADGWSDSAVRRYARDAGHLLGRLNALVRSDCTTRSQIKLANLHRDIDDLETRIADLAAEDREAAERPGIDGAEVMHHLGVEPGRVVGQALTFLLAIKRDEGDLPREELFARLDAWFAARPA
ncbi:MAG: HDIG domain-containing protein [Actinobacteria bacterium]|nr:HDIG domain-containing protein [Actinomycetota bacterium]MSW90339.1 HDIG domain-containing protein [Actinomycetota bacterium]MSX87041.1 HDIG domain-containing protein [Actinomycetota bacterium]MSY70686.1 HDIG domain-containing protein [Actinomycetota bacterium]